MPLRLAFMGTPDFSVPILKSLIDSDHQIAVVYSQPPRKSGRGQKVSKSPIHQLAEKHAIDVRTPVNFKSAEDVEAFVDLDLDVAVVVAYGLLLPKVILEAPRLGCVNIHASLLPRWRGAAPIHRAIMSGDEVTGLQTMQMEEGLDTGPIFDTYEVTIGDRETAASLHDRLSQAGGSLILKTLAGLETGTAKAVPQSEEGATYAKKILKEDAAIDWTRTATQIDQQVRALSPFPGAWTAIPGTKDRLKVLAAHPVEEQGAPGTVIASPMVVACGDGAIEIQRVQRAGKAPCDIEDFLRGFAMAPGAELKSS